MYSFCGCAHGESAIDDVGRTCCARLYSWRIAGNSVANMHKEGSGVAAGTLGW